MNVLPLQSHYMDMDNDPNSKNECSRRTGQDITEDQQKRKENISEDNIVGDGKNGPFYFQQSKGKVD